MNFLIKGACLAILLFIHSHLLSQEISTQESAEKICKYFNENKTDSVHHYFSEEVKQKMPANTLKTVWEQVKQQMGNLNNFTTPKLKPENGKYFYVSVFTFEKMELELRLPFNETGLLSGLFFAPVQNASEYKTPKYSFKGEYSEVPLEITNGRIKLKAILTKPDKKKFPCVILVHGSGPGDMDETINSNKPFKDIAIGLAQQGIATIRYDKRTLNYKDDSLSNTPTKEVVEDAVKAYYLAAQQNGVDKEQIYVLGHSLGGYLAPEIATKCNGIKGLILMAAPARALEDIILQQYNYILALDSLDSDEKRKLQDLKSAVDLVKYRKYTLQSPGTDLPLQIPASYWIELSNYNHLEMISKLDLDILVLNGSNDYQVTKEDFDLWKNALKANKIAEFKYYNGLYHLFMKGNNVPADYNNPSNVEEIVLKDIAEFIR